MHFSTQSEIAQVNRAESLSNILALLFAKAEKTEYVLIERETLPGGRVVVPVSALVKLCFANGCPVIVTVSFFHELDFVEDDVAADDVEPVIDFLILCSDDGYCWPRRLKVEKEIWFAEVNGAVPDDKCALQSSSERVNLVRPALARLQDHRWGVRNDKARFKKSDTTTRKHHDCRLIDLLPSALLQIVCGHLRPKCRET